MYTIYGKNDADQFLIYSPYQTDDGYAILSGSFSEEINKAANLTFSLLKNHPNRGQMKKLKTLIYLYEDGTLLFRGRIVELSQAFDTTIEYVCESDLAFLNDVDLLRSVDTSVPVQAGTAYLSLIQWYNNMVTRTGSTTAFDEHKFEESGYLFQPLNTSTYIQLTEVDFVALDGFFDWFVNNYGGWLKVRHAGGKNYLDWVNLPNVGDGSTPTNSQVIEFGKNLVDFEQYINSDNAATVLYPFGADDINISSVNPTGERYIEDTSASTLYGARIVRKIVYDNLTTAADVYNAAQRDLGRMKLSASSIDISAIDLHLIDVNTQELKLGQSNRVLSLPHGIDANFILERIEIDLADPSKNRYIFGRSVRKLTDSMEYSKIITRG